jgi:hypothetical protein
MYKDMRLDQIKVVLESVRDYVTRESLENVPVVRSFCRFLFCHKQAASARSVLTPCVFVLNVADVW